MHNLHKVHLCRGGKWQYIFLKDEVFAPLVEANIVRHVNAVYAIRPYITKNNETRPLSPPPPPRFSNQRPPRQPQTRDRIKKQF